MPSIESKRRYPSPHVNVGASRAISVNLIPTHEAAEGEAMLPFGSTLAAGAFGDALTLIAKTLRGFNLATLAQTHPLGGANELAKHKQGE